MSRNTCACFEYVALYMFITTFVATFTSPTVSKYQFKNGDQLLFTLLPTGDEAESKLEFGFTAEERTDWLVHHYLVYVRTEGN